MIVELKKILRLNVSQRLEVIERIWQSIIQESNALPVSDQEKAELVRREARERGNPQPSTRWHELNRKLRRTHG